MFSAIISLAIALYSTSTSAIPTPDLHRLTARQGDSNPATLCDAPTVGKLCQVDFTSAAFPSIIASCEHQIFSFPGASAQTLYVCTSDKTPISFPPGGSKPEIPGSVAACDVDTIGDQCTHYSAVGATSGTCAKEVSAIPSSTGTKNAFYVCK